MATRFFKSYYTEKEKPAQYQIPSNTLGYSQRRSAAPSTGGTITVGKQIFTRPAAAGSAPAFAEGDRVLHMTFGEGEVMRVTPMGADTLYEIIFDRVGTKKLMATYAKLKKI